MSKFDKVSWVLVAVLAVALFLSMFYNKQVETVEVKTTDTIVIRKIDTIVEYKTRYITERVVDTVFISPSQTSYPDSIINPLLITQKHYSTPSLYDLWVSGYEPHLDSIRIYRPIEYQTITNEVTREIYPKTWRLYAGAGFQAFSSTFAPVVGMTLTAPANLAITVNLGCNRDGLFYGAQIQYKIFGK